MDWRGGLRAALGVPVVPTTIGNLGRGGLRAALGVPAGQVTDWRGEELGSGGAGAAAD
jgi:hypothetical protein